MMITSLIRWLLRRKATEARADRLSTWPDEPEQSGPDILVRVYVRRRSLGMKAFSDMWLSEDLIKAMDKGAIQTGGWAVQEGYIACKRRLDVEEQMKDAPILYPPGRGPTEAT